MAPERSGSPGSLAAWDTLGFEGRWFVANGPSAAAITSVTGKPAREPIRAYVGLESMARDPTAGPVAGPAAQGATRPPAAPHAGAAGPNSAPPAAPAKVPAIGLLTSPILPTLLRLTLPNAIAMVGTTLVAVAETAYIGRLGIEPLAAICLLYTYDAAAQRPRDDPGGRRYIKKKHTLQRAQRNNT